MYFCVSIVFEKPQQKQRINLTLSLKYMHVTITVRTRSDTEVNCLVRLKKNWSSALLDGNDLLKCVNFSGLTRTYQTIYLLIWWTVIISRTKSILSHVAVGTLELWHWVGFTLFIQSSCHLLKTSSIIK